jgi:hypothetical protein
MDIIVGSQYHTVAVEGVWTCIWPLLFKLLLNSDSWSCSLDSLELGFLFFILAGWLHLWCQIWNMHNLIIGLSWILFWWTLLSIEILCTLVRICLCNQSFQFADPKEYCVSHIHVQQPVNASSDPRIWEGLLIRPFWSTIIYTSGWA